MYKEIFKNGINDKSLDKAGRFALEVVKARLENITQRSIDFIDSKRQCEKLKTSGWLNPAFMDMFNPIFNLAGGIDPYDVNDKESKGSRNKQL